MLWNFLPTCGLCLPGDLGSCQVVYANSMIYGGRRGPHGDSLTSGGLETKVIHTGGPSCRHDHVPIKTLDPKARVSSPGGHYCVCDAAQVGREL